MTYTSEETFSEKTFFHTICNNISADHLKYRLQGIISPITFLNCRNIQFSSLKTVLRFLMPFYEKKRETIKKSNKSNTTHKLHILPTKHHIIRIVTNETNIFSILPPTY